jgi:hypothetical protein
MLYQEILNNIAVEEVPDDHFRLYLAIAIAFFRKRDVYAIIQVSGEFSCIA